MITASKRVPQGRGLAPVLLKRAAEVTLDWASRSKSRFDAHDSSGRHIGVFLPRGQVLRGGDVLVAEDGSLLRVKAALEPVLQVRHCSTHGQPSDLARAAYHLGNRHVALELQPGLLQLEPDHVLADMLRAMHLIVSETQAAFEPEAGAYAAGDHAHEHVQAHALGHNRADGHDRDHDHVHGLVHDHAHGKGQPHGPGHEQGHAHDHGHVHGPDCNHGATHSPQPAPVQFHARR